MTDQFSVSFEHLALEISRVPVHQTTSLDYDKCWMILLP